MYDELKERCRACSQGCIYPSECSYFDKPPLRCMRQLLSEAADAIEELSSQLDDFKRLCLPLKENRLYKYSDGSFVEVFLILLSEPPEEGKT